MFVGLRWYQIDNVLLVMKNMSFCLWICMCLCLVEQYESASYRVVVPFAYAKYAVQFLSLRFMFMSFAVYGYHYEHDV